MEWWIKKDGPVEIMRRNFWSALVHLLPLSKKDLAKINVSRGSLKPRFLRIVYNILKVE